MDVKFKQGNRAELPKSNVIEGAYYQTLDSGQLFIGTSNSDTLEVGNLIQDPFGERTSLETRQGSNNISIGQSSLILNSTESTANGTYSIIAGSTNSSIPFTSINAGIYSSDQCYISVPPVLTYASKSNFPLVGDSTARYYAIDEKKYYAWQNSSYIVLEAADHSYDYLVKLGQSAIIGSSNSKIEGFAYTSQLWGGHDSAIVGSTNAELRGIRSFIGGTSGSVINTAFTDSAVIGSTGSVIGNGSEYGGSASFAMFIGGSNQSTITGLGSSSFGSAIVGGSGNTINGNPNSTIIGGIGNTINMFNGTCSIINSELSSVGAPKTVLINTTGFTSGAPGTYIENLNVRTQSGSYYENAKFIVSAIDSDIDTTFELPTISGKIALVSDIGYVTPIITRGVNIASITLNGITTQIYAPAGGGGGSSVSYIPSITSGTTLGTLVIDDYDYPIVAPTVSVSQVISSGTKVATITVGSNSTDIYAPNVNITTGSTNGTISVNGSNVAVKGLGSAAYTASTAYATAAQGTKADSAVQSITSGSTNGTISVDGSNVSVTGLHGAAYKSVDTSITASTTSANLPTSAAVESRINAHAGIDKVGTVTEVTAGTGLVSSPAAGITVSGSISAGPGLVGVITRSGVSNIPTTNRLVYATVSSTSTLSFSGIPQEGFETHVIIYNSGTGTISITMPNSGSYTCTGNDVISISSHKFGEVNITTVGSTGYVIGISSI